MLTATVSGSFHRHMAAITEAVSALLDMGVRVLSPADPRVVDRWSDFLFVASDSTRSIRLVQDRHLACIAESDFLWLVSPDGYVGQSASMEIGFAVANRVPILGTTQPADLTLRRYVQCISAMRALPQAVHVTRAVSGAVPGLLVDPTANVERAHRALETVRGLMVRRSSVKDDRIARQIDAELSKLPASPVRARA